jgi:hypothetical protein
MSDSTLWPRPGYLWKQEDADAASRVLGIVGEAHRELDAATRVHGCGNAYAVVRLLEDAREELSTLLTGLAVPVEEAFPHGG